MEKKKQKKTQQYQYYSLCVPSITTQRDSYQSCIADTSIYRFMLKLDIVYLKLGPPSGLKSSYFFI